MYLKVYIIFSKSLVKSEVITSLINPFMEVQFLGIKLEQEVSRQTDTQNKTGRLAYSDVYCL